MSSSGAPSLLRKEIPVVVRVKRKASQASLDAFWLEINERPLKRPLLDFEKLSISEEESKVSEALKKKRLLVQHVETMKPSEAIEDVLQFLLPNSGGSKDLMRKIEARKGYFKKDKKHDQLRSVARQEREELIRNARFEQIWKNRRGEVDSLRELCHLYDVVRVDAENEKLKKKKMKHTSAEDNAILCNYLSLLREYIPSAAEEIESEISEIKAYVSEEGSGSVSIAEVPTEDGYVYDLYTVEDDCTGNEEDMSCNYPSVQVKNEDDFDEMPDSEYDSEDSNAEFHPGNDYPDEVSSNNEDEEMDPFGDFDCPNSDFEEEEKEEMLSKKKKDEEDAHIFSDSDCSDYKDEVAEVPGERWRWEHRDKILEI